MKKFRIPALLFLFSLAFTTSAALADGEANKLLLESETRHRSKSMEYEGELTVTRDGKERKKSWKSYREGYSSEAKVLIRFTGPPEVNKVGFLSLARAGKNADQWLYLPSMKRERRIYSQDRDTSFVGTDFSYEDMEEFDYRKYDSKIIGEEIMNGVPCVVIEARPAEKSLETSYEKRVLYLRKDILYLVREDLYRPGDKKPSKTLNLGEITEKGGHHVAHRLEMEDRTKASVTVVNLRGVTLDREQPAERFTLRNLTREGVD